MSPPSLNGLRVARTAGRTVVGTIYKLAALTQTANVRQRAELAHRRKSQGAYDARGRISRQIPDV